MRDRINFLARPFIIRTGFFYVLAVMAVVPSAAAQPGWDVNIFRSINNSRSSFMDGVVGVNDYAVPPIAYSAPFIIAGTGLITKNAYTFDTGVDLGLSEASAYVVYYLLKNVIIKRDRPYVTLSDVHTMHLDTADKYSMPSGHTTAAFAIATTLMFRYPKPYVYIPAYAWAAFVGYGRIYMGLHYPSDVLAGAALGTASAFAIHLISPQITRLREKILGDDLGVRLSASPVPAFVNLTINF